MVNLMKRVLLLGAYGLDNLGDDFMLAHIIERLKQSDIEPWIVNTYKNRFYFGNKDYNILKCPYFTKESNYVMKAIKCLIYTLLPSKERFDSVVFIGGGYTNEEKGVKDIFRFLTLLKHVCTKDCFIIFTGQTVGPASSDKMKEAISKLYGKGHRIYVREKYSQELLKSLGINSKITGDDALLATKANSQISKENYAIFSYKEFPGYSKYKNKIFEFYGELAKKLCCKIYIIPFRSEEHDAEYLSNSELNDYLLTKGIDSEFVMERGINEFEVYFRNAKYVIGSAYHSIVLGLMNDARVYAIYSGEYYRAKMNGVLEMFGLDSFNTTTFDNLDVERAFSILKDADLYQKCTKNKMNMAKSVDEEWKNIIEILMK